jgi:hypothetical protein
MTDWDNVHIASPYDESPDAEVASEDELSLVVNTGQVDMPQRFNPNLPYADVSLKLNDKDEILLSAIKKAIDNGWAGWQSRVNDATTIGLEAEEVVKTMKRTNASVKELLFDMEFAKFLWGDSYKEKLQEMVLAPDVILYLR